MKTLERGREIDGVRSQGGHLFGKRCRPAQPAAPAALLADPHSRRGEESVHRIGGPRAPIADDPDGHSGTSEKAPKRFRAPMETLDFRELCLRRIEAASEVVAMECRVEMKDLRAGAVGDREPRKLRGQPAPVFRARLPREDELDRVPHRRRRHLHRDLLPRVLEPDRVHGLAVPKELHALSAGVAERVHPHRERERGLSVKLRDRHRGAGWVFIGAHPHRRRSRDRQDEIAHAVLFRDLTCRDRGPHDRRPESAAQVLAHDRLRRPGLERARDAGTDQPVESREPSLGAQVVHNV